MYKHACKHKNACIDWLFHSIVSTSHGSSAARWTCRASYLISTRKVSHEWVRSHMNASYTNESYVSLQTRSHPHDGTPSYIQRETHSHMPNNTHRQVCIMLKCEGYSFFIRYSYSLYVYLHIFIHTHTHIYICTFTYIYIYICICETHRHMPNSTNKQQHTSTCTRKTPAQQLSMAAVPP